MRVEGPRVRAHARPPHLQRELRPGEKVSLHELAMSLGVSRSPVHHALTRLVSEGLLTVKSRRGYFVMTSAHAAQLSTPPYCSGASPQVKWLAGDGSALRPASPLARRLTGHGKRICPRADGSAMRSRFMREGLQQALEQLVNLVRFLVEAAAVGRAPPA